MNKFIALFLAYFVCLALTAQAQEERLSHQKSMLAISGAFDASGNLWRASVKGDFLQVDVSRDLGKSFSKPMVINTIAQNIAADGEARPKIAIGPEGNVYLTWTAALAKPLAGYVWFSRSVNGGKTFEKPIIVHHDRAGISHRFEALNVASNGNITVAWVDTRDLLAATAAGKPYEGAAIYYAVSTDKGVSFVPEQKLADGSCDCCSIALTNKPDATAVAMWRHEFEGGERDHMIAEIPVKPNQVAILKRATYRHWKMDGCPHQGSTIAAGGEGDAWWGYHMAYYEGNENNLGLYYSRMDGVAWASSPAKRFGNNKNQAGHPAVLSLGEKVWLAWREQVEGNNQIWLMVSEDGGKNWDVPHMVMEVTGVADYPLLLQRDKQIFLIWNSEKEQLKVMPL
jgi:hypothetical protein